MSSVSDRKLRKIVQITAIFAGFALWHALIYTGRVVPISQSPAVPTFVRELGWMRPALLDAAGYAIGAAFIYFVAWFSGVIPSTAKAGSPKRAKSKAKTAKAAGKWTCVLGNLKWDRNSFCRGWLVTGGTGCGKTQCAINIVMHQVFINETGELNPAWGTGKLHLKEKELYARYEDSIKDPRAQAERLSRELEPFHEALYRTREECTSDEIDLSISEISKTDNKKPNKPSVPVAPASPPVAPQADDTATAIMPQPASPVPESVRRSRESREIPQRKKAVTEIARTAKIQADALSDPPNSETNAAPSPPKPVEEAVKEVELIELPQIMEIAESGVRMRVLEEQIAARQQQIDRIYGSFEEKRMELSKTMAKIEVNKYNVYPWGGICVDEKGLYWQTLVSMANHYHREHHLCLLQTRPDWAPSTWQPLARLNLLSDTRIPANTYANAIVETATTIAGGEGDKGFFKTQGESNIGWAIELYRQIGHAQKDSGWCELTGNPPLSPNLKNILEFLSKPAPSGREFPNKDYSLMPKGGQDNLFPVPGRPNLTKRGDGALLVNPVAYPKLIEAIEHFQNRYWSQPKDQLGGVQGTIYNYLAYFQNEEIAEVFCAENTFNFDDIEKGRIVCVAMPQKFQIERRYVCTLLKLLYYQLVLRRFDKSPEEFKRKNLLIAWQDEAQRFVTKHDGNVDVIREAGATTFMATQSKSSLLPPLGGKEKAEPIILNLRNRMIFKAADDICAQGSAEFLGKLERTKTSRTRNKPLTLNESVQFSKEEQFIVKPYQFRGMKDFTAYVCHAEGKVIKYVIAPKTTDGRFTPWWTAALRKQKIWKPLLMWKMGIRKDFTKVS